MTVPDPQSIRILLVDHHPVVRTGFRLFLESQLACTVVGEATHGAEALAIASQVQPDMTLLDLDLGDESGLPLIPALLAAAPKTRVLIFTGVRDPALHQQALCLGAMGLVSKEKTADTLLQAILKVHAGEVWIERTMMANVLGCMVRTHSAQTLDPERAKIALLTAREREVIALIGEGCKNREIAAHMYISETTVRHHLTAIFNKLGVVDRLALLVYVHRHGLLDPLRSSALTPDQSHAHSCHRVSPP